MKQKERATRPDPLALLRQITPESRRRALLRVYLAYARGAGATTAVLDEGRRRAGRGTDVVVAAYAVHGDPAAVLKGLEVLGGRRALRARMPLDLDALLARNPEVAIIDDLAEVDADGQARMEKLVRLLEAGMTVLGTLHLLSVRSAAAAFADAIGGSPGILIEDSALDRIDELELVDMPPADLLSRLREQPVLKPAELAMALQQELRLPVLQALRETAFRTIAEHADRQLVRFMRESGVEAPWEVRGRIVLCLPLRPGLEDRIRRGQRYAAVQDAKFTVVSVRTRPQAEAEKRLSGAYAALTHQLGGEFVHLHGRRVADALVGYIRESLATEVILGHRRGSRWWPGDTTSEVIRGLSGVDVHILRA